MKMSEAFLSTEQFNYCLHKEMGTSEKAYAFSLGIKNNQKDCVNQDWPFLVQALDCLGSM